jgi:hypothetical protein
MPSVLNSATTIYLRGVLQGKFQETQVKPENRNLGDIGESPRASKDSTWMQLGYCRR